MSFNLEELKKIRTKTNGIFSKKSRLAISESLSRAKLDVDKAKGLSEEDKHAQLLPLLNTATKQRNIAVQNGASSYSDAEWASAAAVESWISELLTGDKNDVQQIEIAVYDLIARK